MSIAALLAPFAGRRQFIVYRLRAKDDGTGKTDKIPIHPTTGRDHDAHDVATWLTAEEAAAYAAAGWLVGIVIYEGCGLFCIDLDGQLDQGMHWSKMALDICARFPGAAMEISTSGRGLHIFGSCATDFPRHRVTRAGSGLEIYTRHRFIALTGTGYQGDPRGDYSAALLQTIADYLPEAISGSSGAWTTEAYPGWRGGGTDEQILQGLRNRQAAAAVFGHGASFAALYDCDVQALSLAFPDGTGKAPYNASAADQALANHLAWATGYNCERTLEMMRRSALRRDKWDREDYLPRTILSAVAGKIPAAGPVDSDRTLPVTTATAAPLIPPPPSTSLVVIPPPPPPDVPQIQPAPGMYASTVQQPGLFKDCVYVEDVHQILMANDTLLDQKQFNVRFGGVTFQMTADGARPTKNAWDCFTASELIAFPRVDGVVFSPKLQPREVVLRDGQRMMNSWRPLTIIKRAGDPTPYLQHIKTLYPVGDDMEILLAYFAACVQYQGTKLQWCPLLQGVEGTGKTFLSRALEYCIGERYTHWPRADKIDKQFNAAFYGKLLVCVEDVFIQGERESLWEILKPMITGDRFELERKNIDSKVERDVSFNFILNGNQKGAVRKTENDRRLAVFFGAHQYKSDLINAGLNENYHTQLYDWAKRDGYSIVADFLSSYAIPDKWNPATTAVRAPETSSTAEAVRLGRPPIEQETLDAVAEGRPGFRGGWLSSVAFDHLLGSMGRSRSIPREQRRAIIEALGYVPHPALPDGRVPRPLSDGSSPRLYIAAGHPIAAAGPDAAVLNYLATQNAPR